MTNRYTSVRVKLAALTAIFSLVFFIAVSITVDGYVRNNLKKEFNDHARETMAIIKVVFLQSAGGGGLDGKILDRIRSSNNKKFVQDIVVQEASDGRLTTLAATDGAEKHTGIASLAGLRNRKSYRERNGMVYITEPVMINGSRSVFISVSFSSQHLDNSVRAIRFQSAYPVALGVLLMILVVYVAGERFVLRPIDKIKEAATRITDGDFEYDLEIDQNDELGELSTLLHRMKNSLVEHTWKLRQRLNELSVLYDVSELSGEIKSADDSLRIILKSAVRVLNGSNGTLLLKEKPDGSEAGEMAAAAFWSETGEQFDRETVNIDIEVAKKTLSGSQPILVPSGQSRKFTTVRDVICAPIKSEGEVLGVICVNNKAEGTFSDNDSRLLEILANQALGIIKLSRLHSDLQQSYLSTIQALAAAIDAKDHYTLGHSDRVAGYSELIAGQMGINEKEKEAIKVAAYLHDIGKIGIDESILGKTDKLTPLEQETMRAHPEISGKILDRVTFLENVIPTVKHHHEHFDGSGYPDRLTGEGIPLGARILAVADAFDAMTSNRPYRKALSVEKALSELKQNVGTQFDPTVVYAFLEAFPDTNYSKDMEALGKTAV